MESHTQMIFYLEVGRYWENTIMAWWKYLGTGVLNNGGYKFRLVAGNSIVVVTGTYLVYGV